MLLAADIGNTAISFGIFRRDKLVKRFSIPTKSYSFPVLKRALKNIGIDNSIICSVVPGVSGRLRKDLKTISHKEPYLVGRDILVPIKNRYRNPKQVGQDRLVNAYAGITLYGAPLIVVDFGTAITFDVVSRTEEYRGGMILPGIGLSLSTLTRNTALLPKVSLSRPVEFIGRDTKTSMLSGVIYGAAHVTDSFIGKIRNTIGRKARVIATGGDCRLIAGYCRSFTKVDEDLTLKGLCLILHNKKFSISRVSPRNGLNAR